MSDLTAIVVPFLIAIGAIGAGFLLWGLRTMRNTPRDQPALDRWLKRMRVGGVQHLARNLTTDQFDRETLVALARYQRRIQGTMLCGMGGGYAVGSLIALCVFAALAHFDADLSDAVIPIIIEIFAAIMWLSVIPGIAVSAFLIANTGARTPRASLAPSARHVSNYRSRWFLWLNVVMFLLSAVLPTLFITNTAPRSLYTSMLYRQPPQVGLLVLASVLVGAIIFLAESVSRLLTRYPLSASDLSPTVEAQLLPSLPAFAISQVWGQFTIMGVFFLISSEALSIPVFSLMMLAIFIGIPYILFGMVFVFSQSGVSWASMANAIALAVKPQENAPGE